MRNFENKQMAKAINDPEKIYTLKELKAKLTEKERIFCHEWIIDFNGARAARKAGYSEDSIYNIASENLTKPHIEQYIAFIRHNYEEESGISKLRNLQELAKIAYSSIAHLHNNWIELEDWDIIKKGNPACMDAIESIDTKTEFKTYKTEGGLETDVETKYVKIKLYSKSEAIKTINEMMGYKSADKSIVTTFNSTPLTPDEIKKAKEGFDNEL